MTRNEFIQQTAIAVYAQSVSPDEKRSWQDAICLADAAPVGMFDAVRSAPTASGGAAGGAVFPPFGQSKGQPVSGASERTLRFYAGAAVRSLSDASKERFHDKERQSLAAYVAEMERQGFDASEFKQQKDARGPEHERRPLPGDPMPSDEDLPF